MISIVACCRGVKLCAHAAWDFRLQQNGAVTRMWRSCWVQPSHKERVIGVVRCKKEGMLLKPLWWCCVDCVIHHELDVHEEQKYIRVARASNNKRDYDAWSLLLLAAAVRSFAHMPLGISDCSNNGKQKYKVNVNHVISKPNTKPTILSSHKYCLKKQKHLRTNSMLRSPRAEKSQKYNTSNEGS